MKGWVDPTLYWNGEYNSGLFCVTYQLMGQCWQLLMSFYGPMDIGCYGKARQLSVMTRMTYYFRKISIFMWVWVHLTITVYIVYVGVVWATVGCVLRIPSNVYRSTKCEDNLGIIRRYWWWVQKWVHHPCRLQFLVQQWNVWNSDMQ